MFMSDRDEQVIVESCTGIVFCFLAKRERKSVEVMYFLIPELTTDMLIHH